MPFDLRPQENVVYPMPYVETETHLVIVTNQRVVQFGEDGHQELPTARVTFVGRVETQPFIPVAVALLLAALPLLAYGGYLMYSVWGMEAAPILPFLTSSSSETADPNTPPPDVAPADTPADDGPIDGRIDGPRVVLQTRLTSYGTLGLGLFFAWLARRLLKKRRYFILCRGENQLLRILAADKMQQTQIIMTIQSVSGR